MAHTPRFNGPGDNGCSCCSKDHFDDLCPKCQKNVLGHVVQWAEHKAAADRSRTAARRVVRSTTPAAPQPTPPAAPQTATPQPVSQVDAVPPPPDMVSMLRAARNMPSVPTPVLQANGVPQPPDLAAYLRNMRNGGRS